MERRKKDAPAGKPPTMFKSVGPQAARIRVDEIRPNPHQPRVEFDEGAIDALARSLEAHGLLQPISVIPREQDGTIYYELVSGERRWRAAKKLGWETIDAILLTEGELKADPETLALIENTQRRDLTPVELGEILWKRLEQTYLDFENLKRATNLLRRELRKKQVLDENVLPLHAQPLYELLMLTGVDFEYWRRHVMSTLSWPEPVRRAVLDREISYRKGEVLAKFPEALLEAGLEAARKGASKQELQRMRREYAREEAAPKEVQELLLAFRGLIRQAKQMREHLGEGDSDLARILDQTAEATEELKDAFFKAYKEKRR